MADWDAVLSRAMMTWGEQFVQWAREDLAGDAIFPTLIVLHGALQELGWRGWFGDDGPGDDGPEDETVIGLRACQHHHAERGDFIGPPVGYPSRDQQSELAAWFEADLEEAHFDLLPTIACLCGVEYKAVAEYGNHTTLINIETGGCYSTRGKTECVCGRLLSKIGEPEQLGLDLAFA